MFVNLGFDQALHLLQRQQLTLQRVIVPGHFPAAIHSPYNAEYDWLYLLEKQLIRFLDPWLKEKKHLLFGPHGIVVEALSNAYRHGHRQDAYLPINVAVHQGKQGFLIRIKDSGSGFRVWEMIANCQPDQTLCHVAGRGIKQMASSDRFGVFYGDGGTSFHLLNLGSVALQRNKTPLLRSAPLHMCTL